MQKELKLYDEKMTKSIDVLIKVFGSIRAGRANPAILDKVSVDYYGTPTPVAQLASVSVPEARTLMIKPWDTKILSAIEKAINAADIGINPANDGSAIRLTFPQPTEERRKELCKQVKKYGEECKVAIRSIRREANDDLKKKEKAGEITEDNLKRLEKETQELTDKYCKEVDTEVAKKEKEILEI